MSGMKLTAGGGRRAAGSWPMKAAPHFASPLLRPPLLLAALALVLFTADALAAAKRVVVVKVDGLPHATVERFVRERDRRTGKSVLPWFEHVFYERGTRLNHFYVRGMSLSGPSWSRGLPPGMLYVSGAYSYW